MNYTVHQKKKKNIYIYIYELFTSIYKYKNFKIFGLGFRNH